MMIDSLIVFEMCLIGACVFVQKSVPRKMIAFLFAFTILSHQTFFHTISDNIPAYYISAGVLDLIVILVISQMAACPRLARDIQIISLVSIAFNFIGYLSQEVFAYTLMYVFLYGWSIYILTRGEPHGDTEINTRFLSIRPDVYLRFIGHHRKGEEKWLQKH